MKLDENVINAVREGTRIEDPKMAALETFTRSMVRKRGYMSDDEIAGFLEAGYSKAHVLEVVLAVSVKTLSNYINHMADTPLDPQFEKARWTAS